MPSNVRCVVLGGGGAAPDVEAAAFYGVLRYDPDNSSAKQKLDELGVHPPHAGYPRTQPDTPTPRASPTSPTVGELAPSPPPAAGIGMAPLPAAVAGVSAQLGTADSAAPPLLHPAVALAHGVPVPATTVGAPNTTPRVTGPGPAGPGGSDTPPLVADDGAAGLAAGREAPLAAVARAGPLMPTAASSNGDASSTAALPQPATQHHIVRRLFAQSAGQALVADDVWFVVEWGWWRRWCDYVDFDAEEPGGEGNAAGGASPGPEGGGVKGLAAASGVGSGAPTPAPGPIDNGPLVSAGDATSAAAATRAGAVSGDAAGAGVGGRVAWVSMRGGLVENSHFALVPLEVWRALADWFGGGPALARPVVVDKLTGKPKVQLYTVRAGMGGEGGEVGGEGWCADHAPRTAGVGAAGAGGRVGAGA